MPGCHALDARHAELRVDITSREPQVAEFEAKGREMMAGEHLLRNEVAERVDQLTKVLLKFYGFTI